MRYERCPLPERTPWQCGPSMRECPGGMEVPETRKCPGQDAVGTEPPAPSTVLPDSWGPSGLVGPPDRPDSWGECGPDVCDDVQGALAGLVVPLEVARVPEPDTEPLAATGAPALWLLMAALVVLAVGVVVIAAVRKDPL